MGSSRRSRGPPSAAAHVLDAFPAETARVQRIDVRAVGVAVLELGGGRRREDDAVDHAVGLTDVAALGEEVGPGGRPLAVVHARTGAAAELAAQRLRDAFALGGPPAETPLVERVA